ncbi:MAG TPA: Hsp33 family molecular chaperone HslO, partial [Treponemataceae bacterium]|nr:Hsp33 family molecular chaperone HslO [Treponemataceae bacterium]
MISVPFNDPVLEARLSSMHPDGMSVFLLGGGQLRGAFFHGTRFVSRMRAQHRLGLLETMVLGQASLCGALLIPTMKGRDRAVFRYDTQGPAAGFSVEANSEGYVRGFLLQDPIPLQKPLESWDLAPFFGPGLVSVIRFPE